MAIIQARLTSTRLPKKILARIGNKTLIRHCVDNVRKAIWVDEVVVASPHYIPEYFIAERFIGSEKDVLDRYYQCAKKFNGDVIVRITSDCPFIDPNIIDQAIEYYFHSDHGYVCFAPVDGLDVEVFSFALLEEAWRKTKEPYDKEHVTPYMRRKTKLSIDTKQDLLKARRWYGLHQ
ncbi:MAG: acylneuraminate cytidylyltransferase [Clostridia bacterium]